MKPVIQPWATEATFTAPGKAWDTTPTKVAPIGDLFVPNTKPAAENMNALRAADKAEVSAVLAYCGSLNWHNQYSQAYLDTYQSVAFDFLTGKYLVGGANSGATTYGVTTSRGQDANGWTLVAGGVTGQAGTYTGVCRGYRNSVGHKNVYAAVVTGSGGLDILAGDTVGASWSSHAVNAGATDYVDGQLVSLAGAVIIGTGASTAAHSQVLFSSVDGVYIPVITSTYAVPTWLLAQSDPTCAGGNYMGIGAVANATPVYTYNGTNQTGLQGVLVSPSTEIPTSLCYGTDVAGVGCWTLTTFSTATHIYRSYDGVVWAAVSNTLGLSGLQFADMKSNGSTLVGLLAESVAARVLYSIDAGANWYATSGQILTGGGKLALGGGSNSFMAITTSQNMRSLDYGLEVLATFGVK